MKDMKKQALEGIAIVKKNQMLDLGIQEIEQIYQMYKGGANDIYNIITTAYYGGLATGTRHGLREAARVTGGTK